MDLSGVGIDGTAAGAATDGLVVRGDRSMIMSITIQNFGGDGLVMDGANVSAWYIRSTNNRNGVRVNSAYDGVIGSNIDANRENGILVSSQARYFYCGGRDSEINETLPVSVHTRNNGAAGLRVEGSDSSVQVISTGNAGDGAYIAGARNFVVQSEAASNGGNGYVVFPGNRMLWNVGACNGKLLFDINGDGPTANDLPEADGVTNAPLITSVEDNGDSSTIIGTITSTPLTPVMITILAFDAARCLSATAADLSVTTDATGNASFRQVISGHDDFAAQAWRDNGNEYLTSEISNVTRATGTAQTNADLSVEARALQSAVTGHTVDVEYRVTNRGPSPVVSLNLHLNGTAGATAVDNRLCPYSPCVITLDRGESTTFTRTLTVTGPTGSNVTETLSVIPASAHPVPQMANNSVTISLPIVDAAAVPALSTWTLGAVVLALAGFALLRLRG